MADRGLFKKEKIPRMKRPALFGKRQALGREGVRIWVFDSVEFDSVNLPEHFFLGFYRSDCINRWLVYQYVQSVIRISHMYMSLNCLCFHQLYISIYSSAVLCHSCSINVHDLLLTIQIGTRSGNSTNSVVVVYSCRIVISLTH